MKRFHGATLALATLLSGAFFVGCGEGSSIEEGLGCDASTPELGGANKLTVEELVVHWDAQTADRSVVSLEQIVRVRVPSDTNGVHVTLEADNAKPVFLAVYLDGKLVDTAWETSRSRLSKLNLVWDDIVSFSLPNNTKTEPAGKCLAVQIGAIGASIGDTARLSVTTNRFETRTGELPVNVGVSGTLEEYPNVVAEIMNDVRTIWAANAGIYLPKPEDLDMYTLEVPSEFSVDSADFRAAMAAAYPNDMRMNIAFVDTISADDLHEDYVLLGVAGGVPAAPFVGTIGSSLLIALEPHLNAAGTQVNMQAIVSTVAHEIGHMMGLFHTSESDGSEHDPIADTPQCEYRERDENDDDMVTVSECRGYGAENLMFWEAEPSAVALSPTQKAVVQRAVLVR